MRCPKCGYISFDQQRSCGKCGNDLTAVAEQLKGTVSKAAPPFFLGAVLGQQTPVYNEQSSVLQGDEEETLALDELEAETPPTEEDELDFAGAPLDENDLDDLPLPSLGLEDIDVSDLMPPPEEEEKPALTLGNTQEEAPQPPIQALDDEKDSPMGIEPPSLEPDDDILSVGEEENSLGGLEYPTAKPPADAEAEEIIDLSSLMDFEETPPKPADREEHSDTMELSLEDGESASAPPPEAPKKTTSAVADIPDLGLTLENDDQ